jgi:thiol-disulfide isomerase/thioredoxin
MNNSSCFLGLAAAAAVALGALAYCKEERGYEGFEAGPSFTFTFYFMPSCPYCQQAFPEWNRLRQTYQGDVTLRMVDVTKDNRESNALGIKSFPTWAMSDGRKTMVYQGDRTASAWSQYLNVHGV